VIPFAHHRTRKTDSEITNIPLATHSCFRVPAPTPCVGEFEYYVVQRGGVPVFSDYCEAPQPCSLAVLSAARRASGEFLPLPGVLDFL